MSWHINFILNRIIIQATVTFEIVPPSLIHSQILFHTLFLLAWNHLLCLTKYRRKSEEQTIKWCTSTFYPPPRDQFPFTNNRSFDRILISRLVLYIYHLLCLVQEKGGGKDRNTCISTDDIFQYLFLFSSLSLFPSNACDRGAWNKREIYARERERERKSNERMGIIIPREWISTQAATTYGFVFDGINNYPAERLIYGLREVPFYKAYPSLRARLCVLSGRAIGWNLSTNSSFRKKKKEKEILDFHPSG